VSWKSDQLLTLLEAVEPIRDEIYWFVKGDEVEMYVNANDLFFWACSDGVALGPEDLPLLEQCLKDSEYHGAWLYCCRKEQMRPQGACYKYLPEEEWSLFHACGPEREVDFGNPYTPERAKEQQRVYRSPLKDIAQAYLDNDLDDEARRFWGPNLEHENQRDPKDIVLVASRGGRTLLTLEDCLNALR
jgi:hypothetical protein